MFTVLARCSFHLRVCEMTFTYDLVVMSVMFAYDMFAR